MKPFETNMGAAGWVECNTIGDTSVLVIQAATWNHKPVTVKVTYRDTQNPLGAQPVVTQ